MLKDIAILTGGKVIAEKVGLSLKKITLADLGQDIFRLSIIQPSVYASSTLYTTVQ